MKTKKFEAVKKLQHIDEIYRSMIGRISDGFVSIDTEGYYNYVTDKAGEMLHRQPGSLLGKNIWKEFPAFLDQPFHKAFEKAMNSQQYVYVEAHDPFSGNWFENHIYPSSTGASIFSRDITAGKKKESNTIKLARRNALILETMQNNFLLTDAELKVVDINPAFCKTIGYSREELLKMHVTDFDVKLNANGIKQNLKKAIGSDIVQFETTIKKKDGTTIDVEVALAKIEIDGQFYFSSFGQDISESKRVEEQIMNEKKLSDSIINSLPGIFYLYNKNGKFLRWNKNFEIISRYNAAEIAIMHPLDFFDNDEKELVKEKIETAFERGMCELEAHFFTKDKEKAPYYFNGKLAYIEGAPCLLGTGIDISERKKIEESIRSMEMEILNQKVQEQKKIMRAILKAQETERNYIGRELHDNVNQILAGTKLYLTMAGRHNKKVKDLIKYPLELIDNCISEIRLLTSKNVTPVKNINLKKLIQALVDNLNKNTAIKTVFNYNITNEILDDELKLNIYRIVQEQINNLLKHAAPLNALITLVAVGNIIRVTVTDDGTGFDINKKREGIGITNMINRVESFNGTINIESLPGKGSKIQIEIPYVL
jgi:PAS domain S-box-containing protein